jgi:hypothetical protein
LFALLLVAVFSFAAIGATSIASASDASTSASKKSKKCKKGYKTAAKGKCKKSKGSKGKAFVAALSSAASSPDATAAKKKKCKKGYKRTNGKGKCKKKKAASTKVSSVTLRITDTSIYFYTFAGEVVTKTPLTSIPVKVTATKGTFDVSSAVTATGDGISTTLTFTGKVKNPITYPGPSRPDSKKPTTLTAVADGISSPKVSP